MPRPRKNKADNWMPPGVRFSHKDNRYIIRSKLTDGKERRLCGPRATRSQVWAAYESLQQHEPLTLDGLAVEYRKSQKYISLSPATQELYRYCHLSLKKITFNGGNSFMNLHPDQVTAGTLRQILDLRAAQGSPSMGNREIKGFLSAIYAWAIERDKISLKTNPCHAVRRNPEKPKDHYVTDQEYQLAIQHAPAWLSRVMELSYLLYARISEVLELTRQDIRQEGIYIHRKKGSKSNIVTWSPRLRAAIAPTGADKVASLYLVHKNGKRITYGMLRKPWDTMMAAAAKENPEFRPFTRHDLKAKGISDQEKVQNSAGHKSDWVRENYNRKTDQVDPPR